MYNFEIKDYNSLKSYGVLIFEKLKEIENLLKDNTITYCVDRF